MAVGAESALSSRTESDETTKRHKKKESRDVKGWATMYYKKTNSFGIREQGYGGRQIMHVCKKGVPKEDLERLAKKAIKTLQLGRQVEEVKVIVKLKLDEMAAKK